LIRRTFFTTLARHDALARRGGGHRAGRGPLIETILRAAESIDRVLWGPWTMIFLASVAVYLTARGRFFQVRSFPLILRDTVGRLSRRGTQASSQRLTPFQATATALASTVGTGNIAGVATALSVGGPGAIFWMWVLAILGMMTKTAEITLAVHYREVDSDGRVHGGPMYYIRKGLGWSRLAVVFSLGILVNAMVAGTLQSHTVGRAFLSTYGIDPYVTTGLMGVVTAVVVIGGLKRIGRFSEALVPVMSVVYVATGLVVFVYHVERIPEVFALILGHAFAPAAAAGGFAGASVSQAIQMGMARGMLSNEAGLGTAPMAHATAATEHPFQQGMWGAFEVAVDTLVICTISAFAVLSTGVLSSGRSGVDLVIEAFATVYAPSVAGHILSFAILTFCLSTQIAFFVYYETAITSLFGRGAIKVARWVYLVPGVLFAGVANVDRLWVFANLAVGSCAIPNLIAVLALSAAFFALMRDYLGGEKKYACAVIDASGEYVRRVPRVPR
jgi:alanine or glycine:cation symporter, AGCS family